MKYNGLTITGGPHVASQSSTSRVMWTVVAALVPALVCSVIFFGAGAAKVVVACVVAAVATEYVCMRWLLKRRPTITDGSAVLTGVLLGMTLPSSLPLGMAAVGAVFAIAIGKMAFGGLGQNIFNPALVGRVFLLISFPVAMTTWPVPMEVDGVTGATVLSAIKESGFDGRSIDAAQLALGNMGGSLGETGAIALVAGALVLLALRIIKWYAPVAILGSMIVLCIITGNNVAVELLSGGLLLGALFMATDYVTSPMTHGGMIVYGIAIGVITFVIRHYGSYPEGISFAILLMNGCTPLINRWMRPTVFGSKKTVA